MALPASISGQPKFEQSSAAQGGTAGGGSLGGEFVIGGGSDSIKTIAIVSGVGLVGFLAWLLLKK